MAVVGPAVTLLVVVPLRPVAGVHVKVVPVVPLAVTAVEVPTQIGIEAAVLKLVMVGMGSTVTVKSLVAVQPPVASVTVTLYCVLTVAVAVNVGLAAVLLLKFVAGLQEYV